jgi:hypothetical protein
MYLTEEDAFWVLVKIAHNYEMAGMWREGFPHLERGKFVLERPPADATSSRSRSTLPGRGRHVWHLRRQVVHDLVPVHDAVARRATHLGRPAWPRFSHSFTGAMLALFKLRQNDILESPFEDIVVILKFDGEIGGQTDENKLIETAECR